MRQFQPNLLSMELAEAERSLASVLTRVNRDDARLVVEDHGEPLAAIVSINDLRRLAALDEADQRQWAVIDDVRAAFADVPQDEHEAQIERAIHEVRAEARAGAAQG